MKQPLDKEIEIMTLAYALLYEIETKLRSYIDTTLTSTYGEAWQFYLSIDKHLCKTNLRDLMTYFKKYPPLTCSLTPKDKKNFENLFKVRNKIAHMNCITNEEFEVLKKSKLICEELLREEMIRAGE